MKKIIASLSGLTLSLMPVVGLINTNHTENISYLHNNDEIELTNMPCSKTDGINDERKLKDQEVAPQISEIDMRTLTELLKIVKEQQEQVKNDSENVPSLSIMSRIGSFASSAKEILLKILKDASLAAASSAWSSAKEELGKIFL